MFVLFGLSIPLGFPEDDRSVDEEDEADGDEDDLGDYNMVGADRGQYHRSSNQLICQPREPRRAEKLAT